MPETTPDDAIFVDKALLLNNAKDCKADEAELKKPGGVPEGIFDDTVLADDASLPDVTSDFNTDSAELLVLDDAPNESVEGLVLADETPLLEDTEVCNEVPGGVSGRPLAEAILLEDAEDCKKVVVEAPDEGKLGEET